MTLRPIHHPKGPTLQTMGSSAHMERAQTVQGRSNTHGAVVSGKSVLLQHAPVEGSEAYMYAAPSTPEGDAPVSPDQPPPPAATAAASSSSDETGAAFARANRANARAHERAAARAAEGVTDETGANGSEQRKPRGGSWERLKTTVNPRARGTPGKSAVRQALIDKLMAERGLSARKSTTARGREARKNRREEVSPTFVVFVCVVYLRTPVHPGTCTSTQRVGPQRSRHTYPRPRTLPPPTSCDHTCIE